MDFSVEVIKDGYSCLNKNKQGMIANGTSTLIRGPDINMIVDTMTAWDRDFLIQELRKKGLSCDDINYVVCTHGHSDHIGNLNLFLKATHVVGLSVSSGDVYQLNLFENGDSYKVANNIEIFATPGHTLSDVSVLVKSSSLGRVVIAGDVFERVEDIDDPSLWRNIAGSENPQLQLQSRNHILRIADYVVPGHGPIFKVTEALKAKHANSVKSK